MASTKLVKSVRHYWKINRNKPNRGENWLRVLIAFGVEKSEDHGGLKPYTVQEARKSEKIWSGWKPIRIELQRLYPEQSGKSVEEPTSEPIPESEPEPNTEDETQMIIINYPKITNGIMHKRTSVEIGVREATPEEVAEITYMRDLNAGKVKFDAEKHTALLDATDKAREIANAPFIAKYRKENGMKD